MVAEARAEPTHGLLARRTWRRRTGVSLAWRNLLDNRVRLLRSIMGIGFAVLLMMVELVFRHAFLESSLQLMRGLDADIVLISPTRLHFGYKGPFSRRYLYEAEAVPGVASVAPIYGEWSRSRWKNPQTHQPYSVQVLAFDPDKPVFLFDEIAARLTELKRLDTVIVDRRGRWFLGTPQEGMKTELAGRRVEIVGTFSLGPDFTDDGTVITSDRTFFDLFAAARLRLGELPDVDIGVIKVRSGYDVGDVQRAMRQAIGPDVSVLTKDQLIDSEILFQSTLSPIGPVFALGAVIGFAVGLLISYQILYNDLSEQLPQYATLKAMGFSNVYLMRSVLTQSAFYALFGFGPAWLAGLGLFRFLSEVSLLPLTITPAIAVLSLVLTLGMCLLSGWFAVRRVLAADPAEVF